MAGRYDKSAAWEKLQSRMGVSPRKFPVRLAGWTVGVAAILSLLLAIPSLWNKKQEHAAVEIIAPGTFKARLTLTDGSVLYLDSDHAADPLEQRLSESGVLLSEATLDYAHGSAPLQTIDYHLLEVPRGGECKVILSDGTQVWLNSMSSLRYPARFTGPVREVILTGEAYFDVAKSETPFMVRTQNLGIRVLGTSFNLSAYDNNPAAAATLVSGSISAFAEEGKEVVVQPAQQAVFCKSNGLLTVWEVDPGLYTGWKEGQFRFQDNQLEEIM
ncbi:MAG: FecR domain-containing protein [Rikenellaceae bacterium]|nr:FecR domain-containing protein [Rikenellaceae bacterium]